MDEMNILIVDDDKSFVEKLEREFLLEDSFKIDKAYSIEEFYDKFEPYKYDYILLDIKFPHNKEGLELLEYIKENDSYVTVSMLSGYSDIATAVEAIGKGAETFFDKNAVSIKEIVLSSKSIIQKKILDKKIEILAKEKEEDEIIGEDSKILEIKRLIELVAQDGEATVLITGETGTGKELVARAIHKRGKRKDYPFIAVALTDLNRDSITAELFGYEKGAFTGADRRYHGLFEQAHKGVLFIDEIGELPMDIQTKLLRVFETRTIRRMGGNQDIKIDVQIITATNRDLYRLVKEGKFREDLYYRLRVFEINIPPLRERKSDIPFLAKYFLKQLFSKGRTTAKDFSRKAMNLFLEYNWPGNVRELKAVIESSALRCKLYRKEIITEEDLKGLLLKNKRETQIFTKPVITDNFNIYYEIAKYELNFINEALKETNGKKTLAWKLLGYKSRYAMLRRIKRILGEFPDLIDKYSYIRKLYGE
ncbi:sigma-54-dependent transcriptional regulator [Persephonella sp.]